MGKMLILAILSTLFLNNLVCQTKVVMKEENGIYTMPCKVNGLPLRLIFDTGASNVSISITEAVFMLKNDFIKQNDILGEQHYQVATGDIKEGTELIIREIEIGNIILKDVKASVAHEINAPLLLGQSALSRFKKILFDYSNNTLSLFQNDFEFTAQNYDLDLNETDSYNRLAKNIYMIPDEDVTIKNIKINTLPDKTRIVEGFTISNNTEFNLIYFEIKYFIYNPALMLKKEDTILYKEPLAKKSEKYFTIPNSGIKVLFDNRIIFKINDWDIKLE